MNKFIGNAACCTVLLMLLSGCGERRPETVPVSGVATYKGKPVPRILLTFTPAMGRPSTGTTDAEGKFELSYEAEHKGAQPGTHTVTVDYLPRDPGEEMEIEEGRKKRPPEIEAILKKYATQKLTVEVKEEPTTLDLKLD